MDRAGIGAGKGRNSQGANGRGIGSPQQPEPGLGLAWLIYSGKMPAAKATTRADAKAPDKEMERERAARGQAQPPAAASQNSAAGIVLIAGWFVPGLGHLLQGRWIRAVLLFASIVSMFALGLAMHGKTYSPNNASVLEMLGFFGDLGNGLLYFLSSWFGWGKNVVQVVTEDYGTKFIVVAGLLNFIAAVDAYNLRTGRKR